MTIRKQKLADLAQEQTALEKQMQDCLEIVGESESEEEIRKLGAVKLRLELMPTFIARAEKKSSDALPALVTAIETFERQLAAIGAEEREALLDQWEAILKPAAPDATAPNGEVTNVARTIAAGLPIFGLIPRSWDMLAAPRLEESGDESRLLQSAIDRATALLAIRDEVEKRGTFMPVAISRSNDSAASKKSEASKEPAATA